MTKNLSKRLSACLNALFPLKRIADVGTDHAYLPCYGIRTGSIETAIAIDVIDGPLAQARKTVEHYDLSHKVELRKGSGLEPLNLYEVEGAVIAGMGGPLIATLISDSLTIAKSLKTLVLQPQSGEYTLRKSLMTLGFKVKDEMLIEEDNIIYTIITAVPGKQVLTEDELVFGPILLTQSSDELFIKKWRQQAEKLAKTLQNRELPEEVSNRFQKQLSRIEEVIGHG